MFSFKCGACDDVFKAVRPCAWCPKCGWLNAAADPPAPPAGTGPGACGGCAGHAHQVVDPASARTWVECTHGCGWTTEKPESAPVLFRFVLGHYSLEFERAALSNSSGAFPATLDHLFAAGYALVEGQDRRDQLLAHLRRLPGYTPDAIEVRP